MRRKHMKKSLKLLMVAVMCLASTFTALSFMDIQSMASRSTYQETQMVECLTTSQIKTVQTKLKRWGYYTGNVDGIYGPKTISAVKFFQRRNGLTADGIVGTNTANALGMSLTSTSTQTNSDKYLLAKAIYAEARGEPYTGQVAVGAVILNRVKNASFPNTIAGVIYQKGAFTAVDDGQINLTPNDTALKAAQDALNGWDPTYGCIYYFNPATATSSWIWSRQQVITIGKHIFCL